MLKAKQPVKRFKVYYLQSKQNSSDMTDPQTDELIKPRDK